ncbi:MAG: hypothetical protein MZU97_14920 [Bacillus subtilis]|nr:hypothetical protein [Bacillus subtilis]
MDQNYTFTETDDLGKVLRIELENMSLEGASKIGLIVKTANWDKDYQFDRYIDITGINNEGLVEVYIYDGDPIVYVSPKTQQE